MQALSTWSKSAIPYATIIHSYHFVYVIYSYHFVAMETFLLNRAISAHNKWWCHNIGVKRNVRRSGIRFNSDLECAERPPYVAFAVRACRNKSGCWLLRVSKTARANGGVVNSMAFLLSVESLLLALRFFGWHRSSGCTTKLSLILVGTIKYIPFASRSSLNSMLQLSGEIEEAAIIQDVPWFKRMFNIIIPIQKTSILSGYLLPFITSLRELTLFMML